MTFQEGALAFATIAGGLASLVAAGVSVYAAWSASHTKKEIKAMQKALQNKEKI